MKKQTLKYDVVTPAYPEVLKPSKSVIPQWYKDTKQWATVDGNVDQNFEPTYKQCVPFMDSLTTGYVLTTPQDLIVQQVDNKSRIIWKKTVFNVPLKVRESQFYTGPIPPGCDSQHFTWTLPLAMELPKGYSLMFTHPLNRYDLPFITLSSIIDADFALYAGEVPFFIKEGFEGEIPQGTPFAQIIPFKREPWDRKLVTGLYGEADNNLIRSKLRTKGWYKTNIWKKKSYD